MDCFVASLLAMTHRNYHALKTARNDEFQNPRRCFEFNKFKFLNLTLKVLIYILLSQFIGLLPRFCKIALLFEKCLQPKNPVRASGLG